MTTRARALAVAAVQAAGERAPALLERVIDDDAEAARALAAQLCGLPREARAEALAAEVAELRAPRPPGLDDVHPDWWRPRVAGEDPRVLAIATGAARATPGVRAWAERRVFGHLVAMPPPGEIRAPADLPRARPDWLTLRIERLGLRTLALATSQAPRVELASLAARLGRRGKAYVETVAWVRGLGDGAPARLGPRRAAQNRCDGIRLSRDPLAFLALGARALAPHLSGDTPRQLAQRLAIGPGTRILAELLAWGHLPIDAAPAWSEVL